VAVFCDVGVTSKEPWDAEPDRKATPQASIWAGTAGAGLWRIKAGETRRFTMADGLGSNRLRSLYQDQDGTLWIGTFGGGLNSYRDGVFTHFTQKDGLLSGSPRPVPEPGSTWLLAAALLALAYGRAKVNAQRSTRAEKRGSERSASHFPSTGRNAR
jgi:Two component regulator propeller